MSPGEVSGEELVAYAEGAEPDRVRKHVATCQYCAAEAEAHGRIQARLGSALYRFDCPSPQTLGEHELGMVDAEERLRIAAHVRDCPSCADELRTLRAFIATGPPVAPSLADRVRRVVATLVAPAGPAPQLALRGMVDPSTCTYQTDDLAITLGPGGEARRGRASLIGLVLRRGAAADAAAGTEVRLLAGDGSVQRTDVDEVGGFLFEDVPLGRYALELDLRDEVVVVEELTVGPRA